MCRRRAWPYRALGPGPKNSYRLVPVCARNVAGQEPTPVSIRQADAKGGADEIRRVMNIIQEEMRVGSSGLLDLLSPKKSP